VSKHHKQWALILFAIAVVCFADGDIPSATARLNQNVTGIIDTHEHFYEGGNIEDFLRLSAGLGIEKTVFFPTGSAPDNDGYIENMEALLELQHKYPDRIIAFCTVDVEEPDSAEIFEDCLNNGGKGLKLLSGHPDFYTTPLNSPNIQRLFEVAALRDVPVVLHVSMYHLPKAAEEFKDLLDRFPTVRVQVPHYCSTLYEGVHLEICADLLDRYPNVYVDLSMGEGIERYFNYMREDISPIKDFILKYQDRITYGTDIVLSDDEPSNDSRWLLNRMLCDFSALQEDEVYCPAIPSTGENPVPGFSLPQDVLRKIFVENPRIILNI